MKTVAKLASTLVLATLVLLGGNGAVARVAQVGTTQLINRPSGAGLVPPASYLDSYGSNQDISYNGRYVVFYSGGDGFSSEDNNQYDNIFVRDRTTNTTALVSRATGLHGAAGNGNSYDPVISSDGTHVAFQSDAANLDPAAATGETEVYVRDLANNTTTLVSRADGALGAAANQYSYEPSISADGNRISFSSQATNLVMSVSGSQVYVRDLSGTSTTLVSRADTTTGAAANGSSRFSAISGDGSVVAFSTTASNLAGGDTNSAYDVYARVVDTGVTELISRASSGLGGAIGDAGSTSPSVNYDGTRIAFATSATNFDTEDTNAALDVYLRDRVALTTTLVSREPGNTGAVGDARSVAPSINGDGTLVAFTSFATNFVSGAVPTLYNGHVFVRDPSLNTTVLVDRADGASGAIGDLGASIPALSKDGSKVAFNNFSTNITTPPGDADFGFVLVRNLGTNTTTVASRPTGTAPADTRTGWSWIDRQGVSNDGRYVVFTSDTDTLSTENDDRFWGVYRRDTLTDTTMFVGRASGATGAAANNWAEDGSISADGNKIGFGSPATNLVPGDTNAVEDCFVRDLTANQTTLVSRTSSGALLSAFSQRCQLSSDGTRVVFVTAAAVDPADTNGVNDVYVRNLLTGQTVLASRADGPTGPVGTNSGGNPSINADGTKVAFQSNSPNLVTGGTTTGQVYIRDLTHGTTKIASRGNGLAGPPGNSGSDMPALDAAGNKIAFLSYSTNLTPDVTGGQGEIFVRDLTTGATTLASRATGAAGAIGDRSSHRSALSADGSVVVFTSAGANLVPGDTNTDTDAFVRNLNAKTTSALDVSPSGAVGNGRSNDVSISANGHCGAFSSYSSNIAPEVQGTDFSFVYMRTIAGECPNDPPDTSITSKPPAKTRRRVATVAFSSNDATAHFECGLDGGAFAACVSGASLAGLADGNHALLVRAIDPAGNADATPASAAWLVDGTAPVLKIAILKQKLKTVLKRGLRFRARPSEAATVSARLLRGRRVVGTARVRLSTSGRVISIKLKLSKKVRRALRRARSARFALVVTAADDVGNKRTLRRKVVVRK